MKKMLVCSISIIIALLATVGFYYKNSRMQYSNNGNIKKIYASGFLSETFEFLKDLKNSASEIVEIEVKDGHTIVEHDTPFTISTVNIISNLKGNLTEGNEIQIVETGGLFTPSGSNPKDDTTQVYDYQFEGVPVMRPGEKYILFLKKFKNPQYHNTYVPLGVYQGKFKIKSNNLVEQQAPNDMKLEDYTPLSKDKLKEKIKG